MLKSYLKTIARHAEPDVLFMLKEARKLLKVPFLGFYDKNAVQNKVVYDFKSGTDSISFQEKEIEQVFHYFSTSLIACEQDIVEFDLFDNTGNGYPDLFFKISLLKSGLFCRLKSADDNIYYLFIGDIVSRHYDQNEIDFLTSLGHVLTVFKLQNNAISKPNIAIANYKALFDHSNDGIIFLNNHLITEINSKAIEFFGVEREVVIGKTVECLLQINSKSNPDYSQVKFEKYMQDAISGETLLFEWLCPTSDENHFIGEIFLTKKEVDSDSNMFAIIRDISVRKDYENQLLLAREEAREANRQKSKALASMSHEIRTPLNSIVGFSGLLLDPDVTAEEKESYSHLIAMAGRSLSQLVSDIIDFSKLEVGQLALYPEPIDVHSFLKEMERTFLQERVRREKENIELRLVMPCDEPLTIVADPLRLRQIISNLVGNAFKFVDEGFIEFGYSSVSNDSVLFYVKDTGVGIDKNKQQEIFDPYGQDASTSHRNRDGSGLGLSISKSFVEMLGGKIWLDSEQHAGSTFYFTLPLSSENVDKTREERELSVLSVNFSGKKVLIADDIEENYVFLRELFKNTGAEIFIAKNGVEALNLAHAHASIDLALLDVRMPEMDGMEVARILREEYPFMIIMAVTAYPNGSSKDDFLALGCNEYLQKPINVRLLSGLLADYFD